MAQHIQTVLQEGRAEAQVKYWDVDGVGYNWINFFELLYYQTLSFYCSSDSESLYHKYIINGGKDRRRRSIETEPSKILNLKSESPIK